MNSFPARRVVGGVVRLLRGGQATHFSTSPAHAEISVNRNGTITMVGNQNAGFGPNTTTHPWHRSFMATIGDSFWVRFTRVSGDATDFSGTLNTWLQLNTTRAIAYSTGEPGGPSQGTYTIEIASSSGGTPIVAASVSGGYFVYAFSEGA